MSGFLGEKGSGRKELFYDKIGVKLRVAEEDKSITFEIGHLLEDVVARIFFKENWFHSISGPDNVSASLVPIYAC